MKLTELVAKLQTILEEEGDMEVKTDCHDKLTSLEVLKQSHIVGWEPIKLVVKTLVLG